MFFLVKEVYLFNIIKVIFVNLFITSSRIFLNLSSELDLYNYNIKLFGRLQTKIIQNFNKHYY